MAQLVISGNENKIDLTSGAPKVIAPGGPDSISILDFSKFPPVVEHLNDVANSVIGPPSNIALTPDRKLALIANSLRVDPTNPTNPHPPAGPNPMFWAWMIFLALAGALFAALWHARRRPL